MTDNAESWSQKLPEITKADGSCILPINVILNYSFQPLANFVKMSNSATLEIEDISRNSKSGIRPGYFMLEL